MESASCPAPDDFLTAFELDDSYAFTSQCKAKIQQMAD